MHVAVQFVVFWALAFVTLGAALLLLNIYYSFIGYDLTLRTLGQEAALAAIAALVEGGSVWMVLTFLPTAARALFIPAIVVAVIYKLGHLEDWSRYEIFFFLAFQAVIACSGVLICTGHFSTALIVISVFAAFLMVVGSIMRGLSD
jgi:hypothetical protein